MSPNTRGLWGSVSNLESADGTSWRTGKRATGCVAGKKRVRRSPSKQDAEVRRILEEVAASKQADLEAWETALRAAVLCAGAKRLGSCSRGWVGAEWIERSFVRAELGWRVKG